MGRSIRPSSTRAPWRWRRRTSDRFRFADRVERDRFTHERFERGRVDFFALRDVDRAPQVSAEARVEEVLRIFMNAPRANVSFTTFL
jgi:hypothetical protein